MNQVWIFFAQCFSSWVSIQILMSFLIVWLIIQLGISGAMTMTAGGTFGGHNFGTGGQSNYTYSHWDGAVCDADPYKYLKPFEFSYTGASNPSYCGDQTSNSDFRFTILVFGIVTVGALFFHTPLSFLARMLFVIYGLLFFASAVLDINAGYIGITACGNMFANTELNKDLLSIGVTSLSCDSKYVGALCSIDLLISAQFFFLHTAWLFCKDKYVRKPGQQTSEEKALLKKTPSTNKV